MIDDLTARQRQYFLFITDYLRANQRPPTVREMCRHFGVTPNGVVSHLRALESKGYIERGEGARNIRLLHPTGIPLLSMEDIERAYQT